MSEDRSIANPKSPSSIFDWGFVTDVGKLRKMNQDFLAVSDSLFIVTDGMGGHRGGEAASEIATKKIFEKQRYSTVQSFRDQVIKANTAVRSEGEANSEREGMGTTFCGIALLTPNEGNPKQLALANIGDSRIYLLSQGSFSQITTDHSLVEEMKREGKITEHEAELHPHRNIITRALGIGIEANVDCWEVPIHKDDRFLLCTDGLSNEVSSVEIRNILETTENPQNAAELLVDLANSNGGNDNITVVVVDVNEGDVYPEASSVCSVLLPTQIESSISPSPDDSENKPNKDGEWEATPENIRKLLITVLVMVLVIGLFIGRYARDNYFVTFEQVGDTPIENSQVLLYQGRTNSILWFDPTIEERRPILGRDLDESTIEELKQKPQFETLEEAIQYLDALQEEISVKQNNPD
tara:strand:- start:4966 stop:6198 length:1233 start_codon:yes stop_codon:yes gene_type:complete